MVIRGAIRGNGKQLAHYLLSGEANECVQIVDVAGRSNATDAYLHQTLQSMSLTSELTKSQKGLYHAQINPAYSEDRKMSEKDWLKAADILGNELGLQEQRRVIVLHTKKGRTHAHVIWERYDHKTGKVIANKFSRLAQDRARKEMERVFEQQPTPHRNQHRPELKEALTNLWKETETGKDFVKAVHDNGYLLAEGVPRHPFMVVDENGRSFDLVRQLKGVRIKEVRQRLRHEKLIPEKEAIELMRQKQEGGSDANRAEQQRDLDKAKRTASAFWNNKQDATQESPETENRKHMKALADSFIQSGQELTEATDQIDSLEKKKKRAGEYFLNADELTGKAEETIAEEPATQADDYTVTSEDITTKPQSIESRQRQQRIAEQFAANEEDTSQPSTESDRKRHQDILKEFMQAEDELVDQNELPQEETVQRQQTTARQFFENEELTTAEAADSKDEIQRLIQEQRAIRERNRRKEKKRVR
ncbi:relaxase/mobilization nuclease domain-containing protein [Spirosoma foliorum]|uniref:Relaxase/mobilization nuclease domain-containing protein n=1 Tax=Spirosoma foliorum TaxID=2710596 RepID=A0A7G5GRG4_9BACT|nr:relaxase/mobilization nuclease domain-containing protein [Spirosoma foliorum]QMW01456.1 relaxase/mobilization nuclease domain-containing protein [Spirosoma foliorum]